MSITTDAATDRGFKHPGGGYDALMPQPVIRRASTTTAGKLYPWWGAAGGAPTEGAPLGFTNRDGRYSPLHGDQYTWFTKTKYIRSPGLFVMGLNGQGKSTFIKRIIEYFDTIRILTWVLADVKGEYVHLISKLAPKWTGDKHGIPGQVIKVGRGGGGFNPLDLGDAPEASQRITDHANTLPTGTGEEKMRQAALLAAARQLLLDAKLRRRLFVEALFTAQDGVEPSGFEVTLLGTALAQLDHRWTADLPPILSDLRDMFDHPTDELKNAAGWRGDIEKYYLEVDHILKTLTSLCGTEEELGLGAVFNRQSTTKWRRDTHVVVDISGVHKEDRALRGALQVGCWITGFGQIAVSHALSDAGLEPFQRFHTVQDEMWDAFTTGHGMVERHNKMTRLDRHEGLVTTKCTHSLGDNKMLSEEDQAKALGMVQRTPMLVCFALDPLEATYLEEIAAFTPPEIDYLTNLAAPPGWTAPIGTRPPGNGEFGIKLPGRPMLTGEMRLSPTEAGTSDTNQRWTD